MKKFVCNGTKDNSNMPLDIEEKKRGWEEEKEGEKNGWMKIADWGLWYWCLAGQSWYFVVYSLLGLTECNCSGLHMVDQIVFLLIIKFYIFSWTFFILRTSENEYVAICYDQESPPWIHISQRFCQVLQSVLSTFSLTANLSRGWEVSKINILRLCLFYFIFF